MFYGPIVNARKEVNKGASSSLNVNVFTRYKYGDSTRTNYWYLRIKLVPLSISVNVQ